MVYKGPLPDYTMIAVKILFMRDQDGMNELVKRVEIRAQMFHQKIAAEENIFVLEEIGKVAIEWVDCRYRRTTRHVGGDKTTHDA